MYSTFRITIIYDVDYCWFINDYALSYIPAETRLLYSMYDRNKNHNSSAVRKSSTWRIIETECKRWRMKGRDALKEGSRRHPHPALITTMDTAFTVLSRTVGDPQCDSLYKHFIKDCLHVSVVRVAFFFEEEILSLSRMIYVSFILFKRVLSLAEMRV